jgi:hypothetical protein
MRLRIPRWADAMLDGITDWTSTVVWQRGRVRLVRVDIVIALVLLVATGYGYAINGWTGALTNALLCIFGLMIAKWMF